jgi:predicted nucleotidyltransferase
MDKPQPQSLDSVVQALLARLHDNLYSVILYGSAVRGNFQPGVSDINLLILLRESTGEAQLGIREALKPFPLVSPFVMGLPALKRNYHVFMPKFEAIRRHCRALHGPNPLAELRPDPAIMKLLTVQALCNAKLRLVHQFIVGAETKMRYERFVLRTLATVMTQLHNALELAGLPAAASWRERLPQLDSAFGVDSSVLTELMALKEQPRELSAEERLSLQRRLVALLDRALAWMEARWL